VSLVLYLILYWIVITALSWTNLGFDRMMLYTQNNFETIDQVGNRAFGWALGGKFGFIRKEGAVMVVLVGFTTIRTIRAYHHLSCEFEPHSRRGVFDTTLCDKFVSDLRQVSGFLRVFRFPPPI